MGCCAEDRQGMTVQGDRVGHSATPAIPNYDVQLGGGNFAGLVIEPQRAAPLLAGSGPEGHRLTGSRYLPDRP